MGWRAPSSHDNTQSGQKHNEMNHPAQSWVHFETRNRDKTKVPVHPCFYHLANCAGVGSVSSSLMRSFTCFVSLPQFHRTHTSEGSDNPCVSCGSPLTCHDVCFSFCDGISAYNHFVDLCNSDGMLKTRSFRFLRINSNCNLASISNTVEP